MSAEKYFDNGIVMLGAGNVATHLAIALKKQDSKLAMFLVKHWKMPGSLPKK